MTDDEIIAVVQAHKEGKKIEKREHERIYWLECKCAQWNFRDFDYRVAPEPSKPREWNVIVNDEGDINWGFKYDPRFYGGVRVREVIE